MFKSTSVVIVLLGTLSLTLIGETVSGVSLLQQQTKADISSQPTNFSTINYKEIPPSVKNFILNQIVNKSKGRESPYSNNGRFSTCMTRQGSQ
jgi:hypothetical protein